MQRQMMMEMPLNAIYSYGIMTEQELDDFINSLNLSVEVSKSRSYNDM